MLTLITITVLLFLNLMGFTIKFYFKSKKLQTDYDRVLAMAIETSMENSKKTDVLKQIREELVDPKRQAKYPFGLGPGSSAEELKERYKVIVYLMHPDRLENANPGIKNHVNNWFLEVQKSKDILGLQSIPVILK